MNQPKTNLISQIVIFLLVLGITTGSMYLLHLFPHINKVVPSDIKADQLKTTIPEGSSIFDISDILLKNYPAFNSSQFILLAKPKEGYLFPDTYKFGPSPTPDAVVALLNTTFTEKIKDKTLQDAITKFGKPLDQVITMASILEGEARLMKTRQIVAGILWQRIRLGMPLQVDAAFRYVNGKTSKELTVDDLKIDSPYNTYIHTGLPPTPISSPGLESMLDAVTPIKTNYLYFLTDKNGNMHYATTLEEHAANVQKYLH